MKRKLLYLGLAALAAAVLWHGLTPKGRGPAKPPAQRVELDLDLTDAPPGCHWDAELAQWIDCDCRSTWSDCAWLITYCRIGGCLIVDGACGSSGNLQCHGICKDRF